MRHKVIILLVAITFMVAIGAYKYTQRERDFYKAAFTQLREGGESMPMLTLDLEDGKSAKIILEHSCCSGAGFDAVAIRTSDGREYTSSNNYCGLEGFHVSDSATKDIEHFHAYLVDEGYKQRKAIKP